MRNFAQFCSVVCLGSGKLCCIQHTYKKFAYANYLISLISGLLEPYLILKSPSSSSTLIYKSITY